MLQIRDIPKARDGFIPEYEINFNLDSEIDLDNVDIHLISLAIATRLKTKKPDKSYLVIGQEPK